MARHSPARCSGFGFLTKMLQAFLVLPPFGFAYLVAGPRGGGLSGSGSCSPGLAAVLVAAGWVAAVMLIPAADRPYVGGSTNDSILQLAIGYNGLGRIDGNETGSVGFTGNYGAGPCLQRLNRLRPPLRLGHGRPDQLAAAGGADRDRQHWRWLVLAS